MGTNLEVNMAFLAYNRTSDWEAMSSHLRKRVSSWMHKAHISPIWACRACLGKPDSRNKPVVALLTKLSSTLLK